MTLHDILRLLESAYGELHSYEGKPDTKGEDFLTGMTILDGAIDNLRELVLAEDRAAARAMPENRNAVG